MNERIQELTKQAREYASARYPISLPFYNLFEQKFVELIVRECADIGERYADGNYEVRNQILEHFGLEEE